MRVNIKTRGQVKDFDIKALYLLDYALKLSTKKMVRANLRFAIEKYNSEMEKAGYKGYGYGKLY